MAKVKITGHASGTGVLTVTAPNTSTDRTITLPDATGTLLNSDGDGSSLTGINSVTGNLTVSGDITGGNNGSIFLLDNAGQKSGQIQTDSSAANALQIDADPDNSNADSYTAFRIDNSEKFRITADGRGLSQFTAKAWARFSGETLHDSHNCSSVTQSGNAGYYNITFANAMANANYAVGGMAHADRMLSYHSAPSTTNLYMWSYNAASSAESGDYQSVIVFGD